MSLPINIEEVIRGRSVEWERLEFKKGWNPEPVLHTLCAFANDFHNLGGGYIFIGVAQDEGRPVLPPAGLPSHQLDHVQKEVLRLGYLIQGYLIQPAYHPLVEPYVIDGKNILVLWSPGGPHRPYKAPESLSSSNRAFAYYIRKSSSTVKARHADEVELMSLASRVPFDDRVNQNTSPSDLKASLMQTHLRDIGSQLADEAVRMSFEQICRRMNIIDGPREHLLPRNVGLMFFNERPDQFFPQTQIDVVQFPDGPGGDTLIEQTFRGPLSRMLQDALRYINSAILREFVIKHPKRAEADRFFNYPYAAIEEALVNAVYHRSYEEREPIEARVLPDHITITSYPGADRSISLDDLAAGRLIARRNRNRRIGEFLKELRLTEGRGTGVPKIIRAMSLNGSPPPRFETDEERTYFAVILPIHPAASTSQTTPHVTPQVTPHVFNTLNDKARILLAFCRSPRDRASIQARLGLKDTKHLRQKYLHPLIEESMLAMTDPNNPASRAQKYKTTSQGLAALQHYESEREKRNGGEDSLPE